MNKNEILKIHQITKFFHIKSGFFKPKINKIKAVDCVTLTLLQGKTLGLVGESGCGKTTLCKLILKLLPLDKGKIIFEGKDVTHWKEKRFKELRRYIQIVFQDPYSSLNPKLKIKSTLKDGLKILNLTKKEQEKKIEWLLEVVGLNPGDKEKYPHEFSGGQRQRICIARAISVNPKVILCDEPVSALDVSIQAQVLNLFSELQKKFNLSYLFISHDLNVVGYMSDFIAVMYKGEIVEYGDTEKIFLKPLHPYTKNLLKASLHQQIKEKEFVADEEIEKGCKFFKRCEYRLNICRERHPDLVEKSSHHLVRCFI